MDEFENNQSDDLFENAAAELEKSMKEENDSTPPGPEALAKAIKKGIMDAVAPLLKGHNGAPTSDLTAEDDKRGTLTDAKPDPARSPKKSGGGYGDSKSYTSAKGDMECSDDDDEDDVPSYFKKKKKGKKAKKADEFDDEEDSYSDDEEAFDASEFIDGVSKAVNDLAKSNRRLEDGLAIFGELLTDLADPRRDKLNVNMAKAMTHLIDRVAKLEKALTDQHSMMKSIAQLPGAPRVAGMTLAKSDRGEETAPADSTRKLSVEDRDRIFKARAEGRISAREAQIARETGDLSVLEKAK